MATRIRLQRHGKKGKAFFHIVAADSRSKRDGKFIEKLGTYNPVSNPATIDLDFDRALHWVKVGAEMSDTAKAILSYKGILYKNHLLKGVDKGAFTIEEAEKRFNVWQLEKENKIQSKKDGLSKAADHLKAERLKAEMESKAAKAAQIEAKNTPVEEVAESEENSPEVENEMVETAVVEEATVEDTAAVEEEAPAAEETTEAEEAPVAEETVAVEEEAPAAEETNEAEEATAAEDASSTDEPAAETSESPE